MSCAFPDWLPICGERIVVRPLREDELGAIYHIECDTYVKRYIVGGPLKREKNEWVASAERLCRAPDFFAVACRCCNLLLGRATLCHYTKGGEALELQAQREIQVVLRREAIGFGFGREVTKLLIDAAFDRLNAKKVFAEVHPEHPRSKDLVTELGFAEIAPNKDRSGAVTSLVFELSKDLHKV